MATFPFYDRDEELAELKQRLEQVKAGSSQMLVLTGRRRIGKTTLVNQAFATGTTPYLFFFVSAEKTERGNLEAFWRDNAACLGLAEVPAVRRIHKMQ